MTGVSDVTSSPGSMTTNSIGQHERKMVRLYQAWSSGQNREIEAPIASGPSTASCAPACPAAAAAAALFAKQRLLADPCTLTQHQRSPKLILNSVKGGGGGGGGLCQVSNAAATDRRSWPICCSCCPVCQAAPPSSPLHSQCASQECIKLNFSPRKFEFKGRAWGAPSLASRSAINIRHLLSNTCLCQAAPSCSAEHFSYNVFFNNRSLPGVSALLARLHLLAAPNISQTASIVTEAT